MIRSHTQEHTLRFDVDLTHDCDLVSCLFRILLVYTDRIGPEHSYIGRTSQPVKRFVQTFRDTEYAPITKTCSLISVSHT